MVPRDALLFGLGCERDESGWVTTDRTGRTSVPGVWAVGNVADPRAQVVTAAGAGSAAAFGIWSLIVFGRPPLRFGSSASNPAR
ncbi:FAD-dependent oxidoreductase [Kitasatospora sp. NPDC101235]|uniref:FAD-dependent oxidoreductase n=1 Tax=Kitasatospora sp. NPDC101235 TaxID=3364101 RepID=UPI003815F8EF